MNKLFKTNLFSDKPYVCNWPNCSWKFSRSDELSRHRRSHSGIKPYQVQNSKLALSYTSFLPWE